VSAPVAVRELGAAELDELAPRLLEIQHAAYAIEAALIGDDRIPPLHETEAGLRAAGLRWLVAERDGELAGALGFTVDDELLDLDRLVVAPEHARRGVGRALVGEALALAPRAVVATGRGNDPARGLYEGAGFVHEGDQEVLPGLWISRFRRPAGTPPHASTSG